MQPDMAARFLNEACFSLSSNYTRLTVSIARNIYRHFFAILGFSVTIHCKASVFFFHNLLYCFL